MQIDRVYTAPPLFIISLILLLSTIFPTGCILLHTTKFRLISYHIGDDDGFTTLYLKFNTSDFITLKLFEPSHVILYRDTFYMGKHNAAICLSSYRKTPPDGKYILCIYDKNNNQVFEKKLFFTKPNISIISGKEQWWEEKPDTYVLIGINLTIMNHGDLPVYPLDVEILIDNKTMGSYITLPTILAPGSIGTVYSFTYIKNIKSEKHQIQIFLRNTDGETIADASYPVSPHENVSFLRYQWHYQKEYQVKIPSSEALYTYYKTQNRLNTDDYAAYVFDPYDDMFLKMFTEEILRFYKQNDDVGKINFVASFVQKSLEYMEDDPSDPEYEYPRYPVEMLIDKHGDCEDKAILTAAILDYIGYNVSLLRLPNHMAVGVHLNKSIPGYSYYIKKYYYLETTQKGWRLGNIPKEYRNISDITVYPISCRPLLIHSWKNATHYFTTDGKDFVKIKILLENLGEETAKNVEVKAGFFSGDNQCYNGETITIPILEARGEKILNMKVTVPSGISTILKTQVYLNSKMVDEKKSDSWFP
ncbi:MAG: hypothetical protein DRN08_04145 [Thermoplasmata archaeon]|nr:MAG: hypothetical protein DRN05_06645 [Thermoplasmata archaeon]RLF34753.1 MAG: hypothetical protein DRN08_04145 [Thermoplasmata archaeon]